MSVQPPVDAQHAPPPQAGRLSIVGTPIGHIEDITLRALETLKRADLILAEDTRRTRKLLTHYGIATPLRALHAHSSDGDVARCIALLCEGKHLALVTDAGMPLISDPGAALVAAATREGLRIETIPGPSAVMAALSVCGLPFDSFRFVGFLARSGAKRSAELDAIGADPNATVFFESPARLAATLRDLADHVAKDRSIAVCRELTKLYEEVVRGSADELAERFAEGARGEITVVVGSGPIRSSTDVPAQQPLPERIDALLESGLSARDVARTLAGTLHRSRRELYAEVQARLAARASDSD